MNIQNQVPHYALFEQSPFGLFVLDSFGNIVDCNLEFVHLAKVPKKKIIGYNLISLPENQSLTPYLLRALKGERVEIETKYHSPLKQYMGEFRFIFQPLDTSNQSLSILGFVEDISKRKNAERELLAAKNELEQKVIERTKELSFLAYHDELTLLPNRKLFLDRLKYTINFSKKESIKHALLFIDLDGFKEVNDQYSHQEGDRVLMELPLSIVSCIQETDTLARMGGDEFALLLFNIPNIDYVCEVANNILISIGQYHLSNQENAGLSASIGISIYPDHANSLNSLISLADTAMYKIKKSGKNGFCFAESKDNL